MKGRGVNCLERKGGELKIPICFIGRLPQSLSCRTGLVEKAGGRSWTKSCNWIDSTNASYLNMPLYHSYKGPTKIHIKIPTKVFDGFRCYFCFLTVLAALCPPINSLMVLNDITSSDINYITSANISTKFQKFDQISEFRWNFRILAKF